MILLPPWFLLILCRLQRPDACSVVKRHITDEEDTMSLWPFGIHTKETPGCGRVLVVDDEASVRKLARLTLTQEGYEVVEAEDGAQAVSVLNSGDNPLMVDVILCDIRMPRINGVEAIQYFRAQYPSIPIIVQTGFPDLQLCTRLLKQGISDYLVKPVEKGKLLAAVAAAMGKRDIHLVP
jgi:two-component system chemotaxis response regulator CheY